MPDYQNLNLTPLKKNHFNPSLWLWQLLACGRMLLRYDNKTQYQERLCQYHQTKLPPKSLIGQKIIWLHAPSLGELLSAKSLLQVFQQQEKQKIFFIITCLSSSARIALQQQLPNLLPKKNYLLLLHPLPHQLLIKQFLLLFQPQLFLQLESDFSYLRSKLLQFFQISSLLFNARLSKISYYYWRLLQLFGLNVFQPYQVITAQNRLSQLRLQQLALKPIKLLGNLKLADWQQPEPNKKQIAFYQKLLSGKKLLLLASHHPTEQNLILDLHAANNNLRQEFFSILAPRHPAKIKTWQKKFWQKAKQLGLNQNHLYIVPTLGQLPALYHLTPIILLGGSWQNYGANKGGHNPKDAISMGCKVLHGASIFNNADIFHRTDQLQLSQLTPTIATVMSEITNSNNYQFTHKSQFAVIAKTWQAELSQIAKQHQILLQQELKKINW